MLAPCGAGLSVLAPRGRLLHFGSSLGAPGGCWKGRTSTAWRIRESLKYAHLSIDCPIRQLVHRLDVSGALLVCRARRERASPSACASAGGTQMSLSSPQTVAAAGAVGHESGGAAPHREIGTFGPLTYV